MDDLGPLAERAVQAVQYARRDPDTAAAKARWVTEGVLKRVIERHNPKAALPDKPGIESLKGALKKALPKRMMHHVEMVQNMGNAGAHYSDEGLERGDAYSALVSLVTLLEWYAGEFYPRRRAPSRWPLVLGVFSIGGIGLVGAAAALSWMMLPEPLPREATPAPTEGASVAAPVLAPVAVAPAAPVEVSNIALWSRALFAWERPEEGPVTGASRLCQGGVLTGVATVRTVGHWVEMSGSCDGAPVTGWASVASVPGATPGTANKSVFPPEANARFYEAGVLAGQENWTEALAEYDIVIGLVPDDPRPYEGRGAARLGAGDNEGALGDLALCVSLAPDSGRCFLHAAEAYKRLGDPQWNQTLSDAVAHDASLTAAASAMRGVEVADVRYVQDFGADGLPVYDRRLTPVALKRARDRGSPREICRLREGAEVEVLTSDPEWHAVRVRCGGQVRDGFLVTVHRNRPTLFTP